MPGSTSLPSLTMTLPGAAPHPRKPSMPVAMSAFVSADTCSRALARRNQRLVGGVELSQQIERTRARRMLGALEQVLQLAKRVLHLSPGFVRADARAAPAGLWLRAMRADRRTFPAEAVLDSCAEPPRVLSRRDRGDAARHRTKRVAPAPADSRHRAAAVPAESWAIAGNSPPVS